MSANLAAEPAPDMEFKENFAKTQSIIENVQPSKADSLESASADTHSSLSTSRTILLMSTLTATIFVGSMNTGVTTVGLPRMRLDLQLPSLRWYTRKPQHHPRRLASGCTMLLAGSIADIVGNRAINFFGTLILGISILASGLARTGIQLILFRAFQGVGVAMCFPTAVSILSAASPRGRARNIGFACLGLGTPFGFSVGLLLGGVFESATVGWRLGFYLCAGATIILFAVNCWCLPQDQRRETVTWVKFSNQIDWIGVLISSTSLGLMSYVFATITGSLSSIHDPTNIVLLSVSIVLIPVFVIWMHIGEQRGKSVLIPNSMWKNTAFSAICVMVVMSWAGLQSMEWFLSLFFQQVQQLSALQASIRFLPNVILGIILNITTGLLVHCIPVNHFVNTTSAICAISPLLMAIINPAWSWWWCAFWAMLLLPLSIDVIFTVANLLITDVFLVEMQALVGAAFNTAAQLGTSVGIAIMAVILASVTDKSSLAEKDSPEALMRGYRAVFWTCFALMLLTTLVGIWGLRGVKKVGVKTEGDGQG